MVTYESLVADPEATIRQVGERAGVDRTQGWFTNISESTKRSDDTFSDYQDYYLNEGWQDRLSSDDVRTINATVDRQVMDRYGYSLVPSDS